MSKYYKTLKKIEKKKKFPPTLSVLCISLGDMSASIFVKRADPIEFQQSNQQPISCMLKQKAKRFEIKNKV